MVLDDVDELSVDLELKLSDDKEDIEDKELYELNELEDKDELDVDENDDDEDGFGIFLLRTSLFH